MPANSGRSLKRVVLPEAMAQLQRGTQRKVTRRLPQAQMDPLLPKLPMQEVLRTERVT
jgi:hypothetical protein